MTARKSAKKKKQKKSSVKKVNSSYKKESFSSSRNNMQFEQYSYLLAENEIIKNVYNVGFYTLIITDTRILLKKHVSHSLQSFKFKDIELVEYVTDAKWIFGFISIIFFVTSFLFVVTIPESGAFSMTNLQVKAGMITTTQSSDVFNSYIINLVGFIAFVFAIYYFFKFVYTLFGKLRIIFENSRYRVDVICKFDEQIPKIINHVEKYS